jgi:hypothetical protein
MTTGPKKRTRDYSRLTVNKVVNGNKYPNFSLEGKKIFDLGLTTQ